MEKADQPFLIEFVTMYHLAMKIDSPFKEIPIFTQLVSRWGVSVT